MTGQDPAQGRLFNGWWLIGIGLLLFGCMTLFLAAGWLRNLEGFAVAGGLGVYGALFLAYYWADRSRRWAVWAAYLAFSAATLLACGRLYGGQQPISIQAALGLSLVGLPFLYLYIDKVWRQKKTGYWWALLPAGVLITVGLAVIELRLHWLPSTRMAGLLTMTFMGGMAAMLFLLWLPNRENSNFDWTPIPLIIAILLAGLGFLIMIDQVRLAPALLLLLIGAAILAGLVLEPSFKPKTIRLTSAAFADGDMLPARYTCDNDTRQIVSPPLRWENLPEGTQSAVLICLAPDARQSVHWLLYTLTPTAVELPEGIPPGDYVPPDVIPGGARQGVNSFGSLGYRGPCPKPGVSMRYVFRLYALDRKLTLPPRPDRWRLYLAMWRHILATGELTGYYKRG